MKVDENMLREITEDYRLLVELIYQDIQEAQLKGWDTHNKTIAYEKAKTKLEALEGMLQTMEAMERLIK